MKPSFPPSRDAASPGAAASAPTATTAPAVGLPLLALGFRPFYLLAGAYAALAVPLWIAVHGGALPMIGALAGSVWHAHEMIFGYAFAVIAGFLFTAVRNWTNQPTPSGGSLALVCALWLAARVCVWSPWVELAAAFDLLFALAVAIGIGRPMIASANRRNYFFIGLVVLLGLAGAALLIGAGGDSAPGPAVSTLGLDLVGLIIAIIAGRVVPMFTNNAVLGAGATRVEALERSALGVLIVLLVVDGWAALLPSSGVPAHVAGVVALLGAGVHALRLARWRPARTRALPILWILHVSYAWLVIHLALRGAAAFDLFPANLATHALTIGAIGGMTLGMMTRTARGHSGRPLVAGRTELAAYLLIQLAALVRVFLPLALPAAYSTSLTLSALLWSCAFALFTWRFWPILSRPRVDGRPG
ncbi:MAG: NnrS family protein [Candidatus Accumulibacter sp.]|uniref:NnrS family protein n=1 Tax=Accumulibacter sp. TaxID=2053492 RepID=UPI00287AFB74|nr:NnrS family protein [Accumulibacter sp.]MDS4014564.1 NnrS family protein [Accumulibacter sp.]